MNSSGVSPVTPSAPCTWIARSMTSCSTRAPQNLMSAISTRASLPASMAHGTGGIERHEPRRLDLRRRLRDVALDLTLLGEQRAVCEAGRRAPAHELEGALRLPEPPHAVEYPPRPEPLLGDDEPLAA